jgi:hypothetical protein
MVNRVQDVSAVVVLCLLLGSAAGAQTASRTVAAGGVLKVGHFANVNPDCSPVGVTVVRLSAPPKHGVVRTASTMGFAHFAGTFEICNSRRVAGVSVEYRPDRGFTGSDSFSLDVIYPGGLEQVGSYDVTVK